MRGVLTYNRSPDLPFDRSFNPYRGCEHGCVYCFARPSHSYLGFSAGLDFETQLSVRKNAAEILRKDLQKRSYKVATIALGTNTDPYQPIEKKYEVTRACLNVLNEVSHPVAIVTRGTLIERDLDILQIWRSTILCGWGFRDNPLMNGASDGAACTCTKSAAFDD